MPEELKYDETFVKKQLQDFYDEGYSELDNRKGDFEKAEKIFNCVYRTEGLPNDTIYYPSIKNEVMQLIRDISQTYSPIEDLVAVKPETENADPFAAEVADIQEKILNGKLNDKSWRNRNVLIHKTALQGGIYGSPYAYVSWERKEIEEPIYREVRTVGEDGFPKMVREKTGAKKRIVRNYPIIKRIPEDSLIWDTNHDEWSEIDWAMRIEIKKTDRELLEMVETQDLNKKNVDEMLAWGQRESSDNIAGEFTPKADDNEQWKIVEFYGWMKLTEDGESKFVRIIADSGFNYLLLPPNNSAEHVHTWLDGRPMIPYVVGYLYPKLDSITGESLTLLGESFQKEENSLRNAARRSAESDLHSIWGVRRGSGVDHHDLRNRQNNRFIWTNGDPRVSLAEFPHHDTTGSAHRYMEFNKRDKQQTYGNTDYKIGINDPSITDTASGIWQMTNAANSVSMFFIKCYNDTFLEPLFERVMHMSVKYITDEELREYGYTREQYDFYMKRNSTKTRLVIDADRGATTVLAKRTMATQNYFLSQEAVKYALGTGLVLPPRAMVAPFRILKRLYELNGEKASDIYLPEPEEILELSQRYAQAQAQQEQQQQEQARQGIDNALQGSMEKGYQAAIEQTGQPQKEQEQLLGV
jgi:hypothetical protein